MTSKFLLELFYLFLVCSYIMSNLYIKFYLKFVGVENNDMHPIGGVNNPLTLFHCVL